MHETKLLTSAKYVTKKQTFWHFFWPCCDIKNFYFKKVQWADQALLKLVGWRQFLVTSCWKIKNQGFWLFHHHA